MQTFLWQKNKEEIKESNISIGNILTDLARIKANIPDEPEIEDEIDYEIIVVIDETFKPSTDLLDYEEYKTHFKFISNKKPIGVFESRRKGLNKATGDIIWFVDSTDFINFIKNCLQKKVKIIF